MTHEEAFLQEIFECPADDLPRRVYADWLMDNPNQAGAARGEFIHTQLNLAAIPSGEPRPTNLVQRERELLLAYGREWGMPFQRIGCRCWEYRRGFVEGVGLPASALLTHAGALFRIAPIDEIKLYDSEGHLTEVAGCPQLARLRAIDLERNDLGDTDIAALAASPRLTGLKTLLMWSNRLGDVGVRAILAGFPGLSRLDLSGNVVGNDGAEALSYSPALGRLRLLDLSGNQVSDHGAVALANSPYAAALGWVDLARNPIGPTGQAALREKLGSRAHLTG
jgi:uncharacterized protein (TIGR02996 family)